MFTPEGRICYDLVYYFPTTSADSGAVLSNFETEGHRSLGRVRSGPVIDFKGLGANRGLRIFRMPLPERSDESLQ